MTKLSAAAAVGLRPGDAVVFEGVRAAAFSGGADVPWPASLAIGSRAGGYSLPIRIDAHGAMTVVGGFSVRRQESEMDGSGTSDAAADATAVLAAAPIEVVAELGRITLRGDEVMGLAPGTVLTLGGGAGIGLAAGRGRALGGGGDRRRRRRARRAGDARACATGAERAVSDAGPARVPRCTLRRFAATAAAVADQRGALSISALTSGVQTSLSARRASARRTALSISNGVAAL